MNIRPSMTEQIGHVLETEIITGVFLPFVEDNNRYSIGSSSALRTFVVMVVYISLSHHVFSFVESRVLQIKKKMNKIR